MRFAKPRPGNRDEGPTSFKDVVGAVFLAPDSTRKKTRCNFLAFHY